jgi:protein-S-isoprenylcysteine O-methyltransferase Ste14
MKYVRAFLYSLIPVVPLFGLPLLGWGIDDLQGFFSIYPRLGFVLVAVIPCLAEAYYLIKVGERTNLTKGERVKFVPRQSVVLIVMILLLFGILFFLPFADRRSIGVMMAGQAVRWSGLALFALGSALNTRSRAALGRMYSGQVTIQENHQLITTDLYRFLRHPIYLGIFCIACGIALLFRSWVGLVALIPVLAGLLFRIKEEEALLHKEFGLEWEACCDRSWRLIPYLY